MIHNIHHDKCITDESNHAVGGLTCNKDSIDQVWHWTTFGQLQNMGSLHCLRAPYNAVARDIASVTQCDRNDGNQIWIRQGKLIFFNGKSLLLNIGNAEKSIVLMKSTHQGVWSQWELEFSTIAAVGMVIMFIKST